MSNSAMDRPDDENPEWTPADFGGAERASKVIGKKAAAALVKKAGRPALPTGQRKQAISIRLDPNLVKELRATGSGWQARAERILAKGVRRGKHKAKKEADTE
jgi:uncharacterized protein (DUF4415 family)